MSAAYESGHDRAAPDLVIFDNDGVLVDSERLANLVLATLLTEHGHPTTFEEAVRDYMGGHISRVHETVLARTGRALPDGFDDLYYTEVFAAFERGELSAVEGVADVLDALDRSGVPYCVASSGPHQRIRLSHRVTGLAGRFDGRVFSGEDVPAGKPAPDLFLHAAASLGVAPSRCAVVEDSPLGVQAAQAAGMAVYGYAAMTPADHLAGTDAVFTAMAELPALILGSNT